MHETYPAYGFATHKGYPTPEHLAALREHGPSPGTGAAFTRARARVACNEPHSRQLA